MRRSYFPKRWTLDWIKSAYSRGELTPEEVVQEIILRAEETKDKNIWIIPPSRESILPYLERLGEMDFSQKPLWGVPFAVKDCIDLAGMNTTAACPGFSYMAEQDAETVRRLILAGAIPVGKTNMDQFATGLVGTRSPYGEVHNALRDELISGGSSSGSAVAVALGQAVFSLGTDTAGSGRVPAALNNLVGYKPSVGAWPTKGMVPACASLDCITVFANNTADVFLVNQLARGVCREDSRSRDIPYQDNQRPAFICIPDKTPVFFGDYAQEYKQCWERTVAQIKRLGLSVKEIDCTVFYEAAKILYEGPYIAERWSAMGDFVQKHPDEIFPVTKRILESGKDDQYSAAELFSALGQLQEYQMETRKLLKDGVLILPTAGGTFTRQQVDQDPVFTNSQMGMYTNHCNLLNLCAVALPSGFAGKDLPFGITAFSLYDQEGMLEWFAPRYEMLWRENVEFAVCGLHMTGCENESQMTQLGAQFFKTTKTACRYQLYCLPGNPARPGLIRVPSGGRKIQVEIWKLPKDALGELLCQTNPPLGFGTIELEDGNNVLGFICESCAVSSAQDITQFGGWRKYQEYI